jgi:hypothetical protein
MVQDKELVTLAVTPLQLEQLERLLERKPGAALMLLLLMQGHQGLKVVMAREPKQLPPPR